jgi:hypothetical protein
MWVNANVHDSPRLSYFNIDCSSATTTGRRCCVKESIQQGWGVAAQGGRQQRAPAGCIISTNATRQHPIKTDNWGHTDHLIAALPQKTVRDQPLPHKRPSDSGIAALLCAVYGMCHGNTKQGLLLLGGLAIILGLSLGIQFGAILAAHTSQTPQLDDLQQLQKQLEQMLRQ